MSMNHVSLGGHIVRDSVLGTTKNGTQYLTWSIALNEYHSDASGNKVKTTHFFDCTLYGGGATAYSQHLKKGVWVNVEGRLRYGSWTDKNGMRQSKVDVVVTELHYSAPAAPQEGDPAAGGLYGEDVEF